MLNRELVRQVFTFGVVGVIATATHYLVALLLTDLVEITVLISNILGYCAAVSVSIFGHSTFTYRKAITRTVVRRFIVVSLSTLMASEVILFVLVSQMGVHHRIALAVVVATIPIITFFLNKFWVYTASH